MGWGIIMDIINKFLPSRKAEAVDALNSLNAQYQQALNEGNDTLAAILRKKMQELRDKYKLTEGDI